MNSSIYWSMLIITALVISGCNSSGSDNPQSDNGDKPQTPTTASIAGRVADGYIVGATVCLDLNNSMTCEKTEPQTITSSGGEYSLDPGTFPPDQYPVVVNVPTTAYDEDTNEYFSHPFTLTSPLPSPDFISPLTTLMAAMQLEKPWRSIEDTEAELRDELGLSGSTVSLLEDYLTPDTPNDDHSQVHAIARTLTQLTVQSTAHIENLAESGTGLSQVTSKEQEAAIWLSLKDTLSTIGELTSINESTESFVTEWASSLNTDWDEQSIWQLVHKTRVNAISTPQTDLTGYFRTHGSNNFYLSTNEFKTWRSTLDTSTGELFFVDSVFNTGTQQFEEKGLTWDRTHMVILQNGSLARADDAEDYFDHVFPAQNSEEAIIELRLRYDGSRETLYRLTGHSGQKIDLAGLAIWDTLAAFNTLDGEYKPLFDIDAQFNEGDVAMYWEYSPSGEPIWTIHFWDSCHQDRLERLSETHPLLTDNCSLVWLLGHDLYQDESNTMDQLFTPVPFLPSSDPNKDWHAVNDDGASRMVEIGEFMHKTYTDADGQPNNVQVLTNIVGNPFMDSTGDAIWYQESFEATGAVRYDDGCSADLEYWSLVNQNCNVVDSVSEFVDNNGDQVVIDTFDKLLMESPTLAVGEQASGMHLRTLNVPHRIINTGQNYIAGDQNVEVTNSQGDTFDYTSNVLYELIGSPGDTSGDVAIYYNTHSTMVHYDIWHCDQNDSRGTVSIVKGNCNVFDEIGLSESTTLDDHFVPSGFTLTPGLSHVVLQGVPNISFGELNRPDSKDCYGSENPTMVGIMKGNPLDTTGAFMLLNSYHTESCDLWVEPLHELAWTRSSNAHGEIYAVDLSPALAAEDIDTFHSDYSSESTFYLMADGQLLRRASYDALDDWVHRVGGSGEWIRTEIDEMPAVQVSIPDNIFLNGSPAQPPSLVSETGRVRNYTFEERASLEPLNHTTQWTLHQKGTTQILEVEPPDVADIELYWDGITDVGSRFKGVNSHLNAASDSGYRYSKSVLDKLESQIEANYHLVQ